jgi:competence protein ComEA
VPDIIVPNSLRDRLAALGGRRRDGLVLVAVVALVVAGAALWRAGTSPRIAPPASFEDDIEESLVGPTPTAPTPPVGSPPPALLVHAAGAVRRPGLYSLASGARVADAIEAAGGPVGSGDLDALNLAEPLTDGSKVEVLRRGEVPPLAPTVPAAPGAASTPAAATVDLNLADQAALETIPGIGPVKAAAILEYRAQIGSFESVDQLLEVSGIGPATLESMRPYVTV